ncbi:MAG: beta-lactamase family protein [Chloroflexi bacterium]|nr:beta-lactamase family protein [Chloroflexota bacterium]
MAARVERGELPGLVTLVAQGDDVRVDAIGMRAFGSSEPMQRDTLFRIASMTKPILAVATLMLVEDGKIRLDDPVDRWLPELANRRVLKRIDGPLDDTVPANRPITVDDLLTMRMGFGMIVEPSFDPPYPIVKAGYDLQLALSQPDPRTPHTPDEWMRRFATLPLMAQPGERWQYNVASLVLGVLVARVANQSFEDLLRERIFEPLGMHTTGFWLPLEITRRLPSYYSTNSQTGQNELRDVSTPEEWSRPPVFPSGAGGLVSTADDYLKFGRLLLNRGVWEGKRLLREASVDAMTSNQLTDDQIATAGIILGGQGWGFGQAVVTRPSAEWPVPGRYGWAGGYGTNWFNDPHRGIVAIVLTQVSAFMWSGGLDEFGRLVGGV